MTPLPLRARVTPSGAATALALLLAAHPAMARPDPAAGAAAEGAARADVASLYNAGGVALSRGDVGPAVTFLKAAARLEPRAADVRAQLAAARRLAAARGSAVDRDAGIDLSGITPASSEAWWLAALLTTLGSLLGAATCLRATSRRRLGPALGLIGAGLLFGGALTARAVVEAVHPEAVVVVPVLPVQASAEASPREPLVLGPGDEVRIGREHGSEVEVWAGGNPIGWSKRSGLWRVVDAPRYTPAFAPAAPGRGESIRP